LSKWFTSLAFLKAFVKLAYKSNKMLLESPHVKMQLQQSQYYKYCIQMWSPQYRRYMDLLKNAQRKSTKIFQGMEYFPYEDRPKWLEQFIL